MDNIASSGISTPPIFTGVCVRAPPPPPPALPVAALTETQWRPDWANDECSGRRQRKAATCLALESVNCEPDASGGNCLKLAIFCNACRIRYLHGSIQSNPSLSNSLTYTNPRGFASKCRHPAHDSVLKETSHSARDRVQSIMQ